MTDPNAPFAHEFSTGENILALTYNRDGTTAAALLTDGSLLLITNDGESKRIPAHKGGGLALIQDHDEEGFLSSGDDGRIVRTTPDGTTEEIAAHKGAWPDVLATHEAGHRAYAIGKEVYLRAASSSEAVGPSNILPHPSAVGGLAFHPNGKRLAASHYNGVSLWWTTAKEKKPQTLLWKGSHLKTLWHPDGDYLMTVMQENALHGWHFPDLKELRMAGYPNKIPSLGFSRKAKWLVTAGSEQVICWPFEGKGPQGKPPLSLGMPEPYVTAVAPHPRDDMCAAGYATGRVILALYEDKLPIEILRPEGTPITALAWDTRGQNLIAAREDGHLYLYTTESIIRASEGIL